MMNLHNTCICDCRTYSVIVCTIGLLLSGSGHVAQAKTIEPKAFDSPALAAAIHQAVAGDTVRLLPGTYQLTEPIKPTSGLKLIGAATEKVTLVYRGSKPGSLVSLSGCQDVEIAHMTLDGRNNPLVEQGISGGKSQRLWLHHLTIRNLKATTWGPHGILFTGWNPTKEHGVTDSRITDCLIEDIGLDSKWGGGIRLAWGSSHNQVVGNVVRRTGRGGIFGAQSSDLVISGNKISGSGGSGLGIEIWSGCPRSVIEDNHIDHWLSVDSSDQTAVRRNVIQADDGSLKLLGIEIIARDVVVTDNVVGRGAHIGLSVSNKAVKNNVYWGYNTVRDCAEWGAQLQGDSGGIAHQYFYRCSFAKTVRGHPQARWKDGGHGFRTNGNCQGLMLEDCLSSDNDGCGLQLGGVDALTLLRCKITGNRLAAVSGGGKATSLEFVDCLVKGNESDKLPEARPFAAAVPVADFVAPAEVRAGQSASFRCTSRAAAGMLAERLWDFDNGIPEMTAKVNHTFDRPGRHRVTLIVWDEKGRGSRAEKSINVLPHR